MALALPSGTRIAFARENGIFTTTYPESRATIPVGKGQDPSLSGDGTLVAYEEESGSGDRRFVVKDSMNTKVVGHHPGILPSLSPDGKQVAFSRYTGSKWLLWVCDLSLKSPRQIGVKSKAAFASGWTPDGKHVLAYSEDTNGVLSVVNPGDGSTIREVPFTRFARRDSLAIPLGMTWHGGVSDPIAYEALTEDTTAPNGEPLNGLFLWAGSGAPKRLTPRGMVGAQPRWIDAACTRLAFTGSKLKAKSGSGLYVMDIHSGKMEPILLNVLNASFAFPQGK